MRLQQSVIFEAVQTPSNTFLSTDRAQANLYAYRPLILWSCHDKTSPDIEFDNLRTYKTAHEIGLFPM